MKDWQCCKIKHVTYIIRDNYQIIEIKINQLMKPIKSKNSVLLTVVK